MFASVQRGIRCLQTLINVCKVQNRNVSSLKNSNIQESCSLLKTTTICGKTNVESKMLGPGVNLQCVRSRHELHIYPKSKGTHRGDTYNPSVWKRIHKHGLEAKLNKKTHKEILWKRFLKKRHCLTVFDRFMFNPQPYMSKKKLKTANTMPKRFPK